MPAVILAPFPEVLADVKAGKMVIMVDDENRENEGDLVIATEMVTEEVLGFMMNHARGLICVSLSVERAKLLDLPLQALSNESAFQTPFAVSVDHKNVVGQGVTAKGRAYTMLKLVADDVQASDFVCPGHVFPLIVNPAGVRGRQGQTEGSYDLARLAGLKPSGVICEILNPDGTMARDSQLIEFANNHNFKITSVAQVLSHLLPGT